MSSSWQPPDAFAPRLGFQVTQPALCLLQALGLAFFLVGSRSQSRRFVLFDASLAGDGLTQRLFDGGCSPGPAVGQQLDEPVAPCAFGQRFVGIDGGLNQALPAFDSFAHHLDRRLEASGRSVVTGQDLVR